VTVMVRSPPDLRLDMSISAVVQPQLVDSLFIVNDSLPMFFTRNVVETIPSLCTIVPKSKLDGEMETLASSGMVLQDKRPNERIKKKVRTKYFFI